MRMIISMVALLLSFQTTSALAEKARPFAFVPSKGEGPFPVAVWLHGYRGYAPNGYCLAGTEAMQKHADALGAVIVGFPGTTELGDDTQQWSEEPVADHAYVQHRLKELAAMVKLDLTRVGLFGFSQGALVAADLATLYPEHYLGAIIMSPGGFGGSKAPEMRHAMHASQVYFCFCGALEQRGNVMLTKAYAGHLEQVLGAKVTLKLEAGTSDHTRPADFVEKFPEWRGAILKARPKSGEVLPAR